MKMRFVAFFSHLLVSIFLISVFLFLIFKIWYIEPFDALYSTWDIIKIVAGVDLILGPLLTFVVFDMRKKRSELARDLSIIFAIQLTALVWGGYVAQKARPLYAAMFNGVILSLTLNEVSKSTETPAVEMPGLLEPVKFVYVLPPRDSEEYGKLLRDIYYNDAPDVGMRVERFREMSEYREEALKHHLQLDQVLDKNPKGQKVYDAYMRSRATDGDIAFYPIKGSTVSKTAVIDLKSARILDIIDSFY